MNLFSLSSDTKRYAVTGTDLQGRAWTYWDTFTSADGAQAVADGLNRALKPTVRACHVVEATPDHVHQAARKRAMLA